MNRNLLSENMMRFGTKNLSEGSKRTLTLESIMQTIAEHGLKSAVINRLLEGLGNLDAKIKTAMETQITSFNTAFKKQYPNSKYYLQVLESSSPSRGDFPGDERYSLSISLFQSGVPGEINVGLVTFQQDINGTIFQKGMQVNKAGGNSATQRIGLEYANDAAKTQAPDQNAISTALSSSTTGPNFKGLDREIKDAFTSNLQQYIVRALMDAFKAIQVYPTSANNRENFNLQKGKQTQTGGATKGASPYKKA